MSTIKTDTLQNVAGTKSVPVTTVVDGSAKAWVNFNGTGTVAIRAAFNVSSITDNGTGDYTANFTNAMSDANYAASINIGRGDGGAGGWSVIKETAANAYTSLTTTSARVQASNSAGTPADVLIVSVVIFR